MTESYINPMCIPGYTSSDQMNIIGYIADILPTNAKVLEIGCALGRSTIGWLNRIPDDCELYVVDTFTQHQDSIPSMVNPSPGWHPTDEDDLAMYEEIIRYFKAHSHYDTWEYVVRKHKKYSNIASVSRSKIQDYMVHKPQSSWDAVYIDALDEVQEVVDTLNYFQGAELICGDDYNTSRHVNTTKAVHRFLEERLDNNDEWALYTFPHCSFFCLTRKYSETSKKLRDKIYRNE